MPAHILQPSGAAVHFHWAIDALHRKSFLLPRVWLFCKFNITQINEKQYIYYEG